MSHTDDAIYQLGLAVTYRLEGADFALDVRNSMSDLEFGALYNGIGPERWTQEARETITGWLALFAPAALIHDLRYTFADGSRKAYIYANFEFRDNCRILADLAYPWYSWRRYRARAVGEILYRGVASSLGWESWLEATNKNKNKNKNTKGKTNE